jgi:hypothetical protein
MLVHSVCLGAVLVPVLWHTRRSKRAAQQTYTSFCFARHVGASPHKPFDALF